MTWKFPSPFCPWETEVQRSNINFPRWQSPHWTALPCMVGRKAWPRFVQGTSYTTVQGSPSGYSLGLFFSPKLLSSLLHARGNADQIPLTDKAEHRLCVDVMGVWPGEGEISEVCSQHLGATHIPLSPKPLTISFLWPMTFCYLYEWNFQLPYADLLSRPLETRSPLNFIFVACGCRLV